ncbi:MAG: hypothetical protein JXR68_12980 [Bacteroidales bacterium]|nr:hypothetical protein [Bacteroidales bacterium]
MKATSITYEKLVNLGDFNHEKFSITIELDDHEKSSDGFEAAKKIVQRNLSDPKIKIGMTTYTKEELEQIIKNKNNYNYQTVKSAETALMQLEDKEELPF